jgi:opacity protein-like surface antigen
MTIHSTLLASAVLAVLSLSAAQAAQPLQAARAGDQVPAALVAAPLPADESEHAPLSLPGRWTRHNRCRRPRRMPRSAAATGSRSMARSCNAAWTCR